MAAIRLRSTRAKPLTRRNAHCHGPNMVNSGTITPDLRHFQTIAHALRHHGEAGQDRCRYGYILSDGEIGDIWAYATSWKESMKAWLAATAAAIPCSGSGDEARAADEALRVRLDETARRFPRIIGAADSGFDAARARARQRLGRTLQIQWFESKLDEDLSPGARSECPAFGRPLRTGRRLCPHQAICSLFPAPKPQSSRILMEPPGMHRRRRVPLGVLAPSQPYIHSPLTRRARPKGARPQGRAASAISPGSASPSKAARLATPS